MTAFVDGFHVGAFRTRSLMASRTDPDASGALVTARRFTDASRLTALPDKLAGFIYRLSGGKGYQGYAVTARHRRLTCRDLGRFGTGNAAELAIAEAYDQRDGHPLKK